MAITSVLFAILEVNQITARNRKIRKLYFQKEERGRRGPGRDTDTATTPKEEEQTT